MIHEIETLEDGTEIERHRSGSRPTRAKEQQKQRKGLKKYLSFKPIQFTAVAIVGVMVVFPLMGRAHDTGATIGFEFGLAVCGYLLCLVLTAFMFEEE